MAYRECGGFGASDIATGILCLEDGPESGEGDAQGGVRRLMAALLFNSAQAYMSFSLTRSKQGKRKYGEAYEWVHSSDRAYIFSFLNVCDCLGINPEWMRRGLEARCLEYKKEGRRPRRTF